MIYMDNAATTAVRKEVAEAMLPYLLGDYGNPSGVYRLSEKAYKAMGLAGAAGIAVGIVVTVIGIAAGVISIISGARLLKEKKGILF